MYWAAAQLEPQRERLALHCLSKVHGYEVYSPRFRPPGARREAATRPLFVGYAFVRIVSGWWDARWSPGIVRIVLAGDAPARVPDHVIAELRGRERNGLVELPPRLKRGDPVRILRGPFAERFALYQEQTGHERVAVLLALLGSAQRRVTLPRRDVEAV